MDDATVRRRILAGQGPSDDDLRAFLAELVTKAPNRKARRAAEKMTAGQLRDAMTRVGTGTRGASDMLASESRRRAIVNRWRKG